MHSPRDSLVMIVIQGYVFKPDSTVTLRYSTSLKSALDECGNITKVLRDILKNVKDIIHQGFSFIKNVLHGSKQQQLCY